jgi:hypothetical protein
MARDDVAKGPIEGGVGRIDPDPGGGHRLFHDGPIVANLEAGAGRGEVEAVVAGAEDGECLAEAAGAGGELRGETGGEGAGQVVVPVEAAVVDHLLDSRDWLEGTNEDAAGLSFGFAGYVHAEVAAVDGVDVGVPGVAEEDLVAGSGAAVSVCGGVDGVIVGAEVGFNLDDAAGDHALTGAVDEELAEQARSDEGRRELEEFA